MRVYLSALEAEVAVRHKIKVFLGPISQPLVALDGHDDSKNNSGDRVKLGTVQ